MSSTRRPAPSNRQARSPPAEQALPTSRSTTPATPPSSPTTSAPASPPTASSPTAPSASRSTASTSKTTRSSARSALLPPARTSLTPTRATISPDNRFLLVCDLGTDHITVFLIHPETGQLSDPHTFTNDHPGCGPRHVAFHPNGRWVYGINEIDSTIDHYLWTATRFSDTPQGLLVNTNTPVKTIAADFPADKNTAAELAISSDGLFLYASNRGEDSLVVFSISPKDGKLDFVQRISCGGKTPRHFTLDPTNQWLLCGNQDSATITIFRRDTATGKLTGPTQTVPLDSPLYTLFV